MEHEYKTFPALVTETNEEQGIVDAVFAVFGNVDGGRDVLHPGAFRKTFAERGHKVRVLDHHKAQSVLNVIGKPLELREMTREQLPASLLESNPEATGGAFVKVQFLMDTPEGKGAFVRLRDKAVDEWSFGYDALDVDFTKKDVGGEQVTVRNLRTVKLYEVSPVIWGMNPATTTVGAKAADDLLTERKEALVASLRAALAEAEALVGASPTDTPAVPDAPADDAGREETATDAGAEPPVETPALTPEQEALRLDLLSQINSHLEG
jgi:HK97 family phage prohead protease